LRTDLSASSQTRIGSDTPGPVTLGAAITDPSWVDPNKPAPQTRIVAFTSGALLEPLSLFSQVPGNIDLFMNSLTWLEEKPENLSVRSKSLFLLPLRMNAMQLIIFGALFVIIIPVGLFVAGFITWIKRRHL
jgi:ABC-type uncharacterized transport system involved in gliding motility auxiliary subunit